jgi:hypothetical protein
MVFAMLFWLQKPYFYKNTMFAAAAAAVRDLSVLSQIHIKPTPQPYALRRR